MDRLDGQKKEKGKGKEEELLVPPTSKRWRMQYFFMLFYASNLSVVDDHDIHDINVSLGFHFIGSDLLCQYLDTSILSV